MENKETLRHLFREYIDGKYTVEELDRLLSHFRSEDNETELRSLVEAEFDQKRDHTVFEGEIDTIYRSVRTNLKRLFKPHRRIRGGLGGRVYWRIAGVASSIALLLLYLYLTVPFGMSPPVDQKLAVTEDVLPGGNRAKLTFDNGESIDLDEKTTRIHTASEIIRYEDGTPVVDREKNGYITIETPLGGQYQIDLPDGTLAWLNAGSSLRFPSQFDNEERKVTVTGEVYFEVAHRPAQPFLVVHDNLELRVLGTAFNINTYEDEGPVTTTLVEGRVALRHSGQEDHIQLGPGEQARWVGEKFNVRPVDVRYFTAWKDGVIIFSQADLPAIIRQIERWYDVKFELPDLPPTDKVYGEVRKDIPLSEILRSLEMNYGLSFTIKGRRVMVNH